MNAHHYQHSPDYEKTLSTDLVFACVFVKMRLPVSNGLNKNGWGGECPVKKRDIQRHVGDDN